LRYELEALLCERNQPAIVVFCLAGIEADASAKQVNLAATAIDRKE